MGNGNESTERIVAGVCGLLLLSAHVVCMAALPPDPNNAALLYYQAFLACPEPDDTTSESLHRMLGGAEPNEAVREYVSGGKRAFRLVEAAVQIPACDWGFLYSQGAQLPKDLLLSQRRLAVALAADASTHALAGNYRMALTQSILMCRMAGHAGRYGITTENIAYGTMRRVLGRMPPDARTMEWLRNELASATPTPPDLVDLVRTDIELTLQSARTNNKTLPWLRDELAKQAGESDKPRFREMSDDELIDLARGSCKEFLDESRRIMDGNLPYEQTYAKLQTLTKGLEEQAKSIPAIFLSLRFDMEQMLRHYAMQVGRQSRLNVLQIAMEIYIETAKTGRLPRGLPPNQPLDPLTNQEFDYEITKTGFILRSQDGHIPDNGGVIYEFMVSDPNALKQPEPWETPAKIPQMGPIGASAAADAKPQYKGVNDLEAIAQDTEVPADARERARAARDRLRTRTAQGLPTPEPILIRVSLCRTTDLAICLNVIGVDQDLDTVGLRIKEASTTPDGQITSLTENYPIYLRARGPYFEMDPLFPITIRNHGQRRDDDAWETFLIDSYDLAERRRSGEKADQRRYGKTMPPVWISKPEPDKVRVFVCLYDRQRHESDYVEVENLLDQKPVDPFIYMQMFQSWLEEHSKP